MRATANDPVPLRDKKPPGFSERPANTSHPTH